MSELELLESHAPSDPHVKKWGTWSTLGATVVPVHDDKHSTDEVITMFREHYSMPDGTTVVPQHRASLGDGSPLPDSCVLMWLGDRDLEVLAGGQRLAALRRVFFRESHGVTAAGLHHLIEAAPELEVVDAKDSKIDAGLLRSLMAADAWSSLKAMRCWAMARAVTDDEVVRLMKARRGTFWSLASSS